LGVREGFAENNIHPMVMNVGLNPMASHRVQSKITL